MEISDDEAITPPAIIFKVRAPGASLNRNEGIYVVGNVPMLGSWNESQAIPMWTTAKLYPLWISPPVEILRAAPFEYKYFRQSWICRDQSATCWEPMAGRTLAANMEDVIVVVDTFGISSKGRITQASKNDAAFVLWNYWTFSLNLALELNTERVETTGEIIRFHRCDTAHQSYVETRNILDYTCRIVDDTCREVTPERQIKKSTRPIKPKPSMESIVRCKSMGDRLQRVSRNTHIPNTTSPIDYSCSANIPNTTSRWNSWSRALRSFGGLIVDAFTIDDLNSSDEEKSDVRFPQRTSDGSVRNCHRGSRTLPQDLYSDTTTKKELVKLINRNEYQSPPAADDNGYEIDNQSPPAADDNGYEIDK